MLGVGPSGGVDDAAVGSAGQVSLERCILIELEEETGIGASELSAHSRAVALVKDPQSHVTDVGIMLSTASSAAQIQHRFAALEIVNILNLKSLHPPKCGRFGATGLTRWALFPPPFWIL